MEQNTGAVYLTRQRLTEIENELIDLKTNHRKSIAERIAEARAQGDLSENAEYDAAKEAQGHLELKIAKLENLLSRVTILNPEDITADEVRILSCVTIKDMSIKEEITYTLVSPEEADFEMDKISVTSPVGKSLLNKKVGDVVIVEVPAGTVKYEVLEITKSI
ncbi:MAG TPA: transcription elongation factor GreA [Ignavibacteria bacterium]|nr:transcription elongation factor GreA [Ignavibacteria bacterium]